MNHFFYKRIIIALILLLGISVVLNIFLYVNLKEQFIRDHILLVFPFGSKVDYSNFSQPSEKTRITFVGDSRAHAWGNFYDVDTNRFETLNLGNNGFSTLREKLKLENYGYPTGGDISVIQIGVNDLKCASLFMDKRDELRENCIHNTSEIISIVEKIDSIVILTTVFPVPNLPLSRRLFYGKNNLNEEIRYINRELLKLESENVKIFDAYSLLVNEDGYIKKEYSKDYLHLNREGYNLLNKELTNFILEIQKSNGK